MGLKQTKIKKTNNPLEVLELKQRRRQEARAKSKKNTKKNKQDVMPFEPVPPSNIIVPQSINIDTYNQLVTDELRKQLQTKFSTFILNQLLLSIQFYVNFEREKLSARERCSAEENRLNERLQTHSIILPNVLEEALEKHVRYQPKHGPQKNVSMNLHIPTAYIVSENVEISKPEDTNYDVISPICKVFIDSENMRNATDREKLWKGYVRLKFGQTPHTRMSVRNMVSIRRLQNNANIPSGDTNVQEVHQLEDEGSVYGAMDKRNSDCSSKTYDYAYIINLNSHHPLNELVKSDLHTNGDSTILPDYCITNVIISTESESDIKTDGSDSERGGQSDSDDEFGYESDSELVQVRYLNSKEYLRYFAQIFKEKVANDMDLTEEDLNVATCKGASFFTSSYEIVPALHFPHWPDCAFEWTKRKRNFHVNPFNQETLVWPTPEMQKTVLSFGCHAIPLGHISKKEKNPTRDLEWKIVFPEAERFLESHLSSTQVKIYMLCKVLIKTYIDAEERGDVAMFSLDHLRAHLFWTCEENYIAWPEEFLGDALLRFLRSFLNRLSLKQLPDYFIAERNLFENIPESNMVKLHKIISQIIQNPVMHIMMAYRNLNLDREFFPKLNYKKLYAFIVVDDPLVIEQMARSIKISMTYDKAAQKEEKLPQDADSENEHREGLIGYSHKKEMKDRSKRRKTKILKQQEKFKMRKKLEAEQKRRGSEDSIDLEFVIKEQYIPSRSELRSTSDEVRRAHVIKMFINYFISMTKVAYKLKNMEQCKINLNQANRLCTLLNEYCYEEYARQLLNKIELIRKTLQSSKQASDTFGPALPLRINLPSSSRQNKRTLDNSMKTVQFNEEFNFIEPRQFFIEADVHTEPKDLISRKGNMKPNSILKQSGISRSERNERTTSICTNDSIPGDDDSILNTEL